MFVHKIVEKYAYQHSHNDPTAKKGDVETFFKKKYARCICKNAEYIDDQKAKYLFSDLVLMAQKDPISTKEKAGECPKNGSYRSCSYIVDVEDGI